MEPGSQSPERDLPRNAEDANFADELIRRLREVTPTPSQARILDIPEVEARNKEIREELAKIGFPPCYPENLKLPSDPPEDCRAIVEYFQAYGCEDDVLFVQNSRVRRFKGRQMRARQKRDFQHYLRENIRRRRKYGYNTAVLLARDFDKHSRLQNWIEYEDYELWELESMERRRDLVSSDERFNVAVPAHYQSDDFRGHATVRGFQMEGLDRKIARHQTLLDRIKREREKMSVDSEPRRLRSRDVEQTAKIPMEIGSYKMRKREEKKGLGGVSNKRRKSN